MKIVDGIKHKRDLAEHLVSYWNTRKMKYSTKWAENYVAKGHREEIIGDKFLVAIENGKVAGSISIVLWEKDLAELRDFYVKPEYRKKGIGRALLEEALRFCKKKKIRKVHGKLFPQYLPFFRQYGFQSEGKLKSHFAEGEDLIIIGKFLKK